MKWVVRAYLDEGNQRKFAYEKRCNSIYELHIAVEEAIVTPHIVVVITEVK